jgi:hypothetical protein
MDTEIHARIPELIEIDAMDFFDTIDNVQISKIVY